MTKKKTPQTIEECNAEIEKLPVEWNSSSRSIIKGCAYALRKVGNVALRRSKTNMQWISLQKG